MFYFAHAGHEHHSEVSYTGLLILALAVLLLLLITGIAFYVKRQKKSDD
jgi:hypothetical protein